MLLLAGWLCLPTAGRSPPLRSPTGPGNALDFAIRTVLGLAAGRWSARLLDRELLLAGWLCLPAAGRSAPLRSAAGPGNVLDFAIKPVQGFDRKVGIVFWTRI